MSRDDGFQIADIDVGILDDPKVRSLIRSTRDEGIIARCLVGYWAVLTGSWAHGERVTLDDAAPLWLTGLDDLASRLREAGLIDVDGKIPDKAWQSWYHPAALRRIDARRRSIYGGLVSRGMSPADANAEADRRLAALHSSLARPKVDASLGRPPTVPTVPTVPTEPTFARAGAGEGSFEGYEAEEWAPFLDAWGERFRRPPRGSEDQPKSQRSILWAIVQGYPNRAAEWCRSAPANSSSFDVVAYVRSAWLRANNGAA